MCDAENNCMELRSVKHNKVLNEDISHEFENDLKDLPKVLLFIQRLQECINKHRNIISNLFDRIDEKNFQGVRVSQTYLDASTQTFEEDFQHESENVDNENIVDKVKEIAESAVRQTGFVYEANSGMYYDYNTGYYYNAELGLYYDGNSGTYYKYDEESKTFCFHSSVAQETDQVEASLNDMKKDGALSTDDRKKETDKMELEEGECSDDNDIIIEEEEKKVDDRVEDISKPHLKVTISTSQSKDVLDENSDELCSIWPPCMRVVVQETKLDKLDVGTLFIVTCSGGSLGREGSHAITIPDIAISKHHASFKFSDENKFYTVVDLGSRNGTYLNGNRLSVALQESPPHMIEHGSVLRVGSTSLLCHIHPGHETCTDCEPGCLVKPQKDEVLIERKPARHRSELRRLRRKYGLEGPGSGAKVSNNSADYVDRADVRRKTVGSSNDCEKTEVASVYQSIKSDNKGFKMLAKMGWSEGQTLGKESNLDSAINEPLKIS